MKILGRIRQLNGRLPSGLGWIDSCIYILAKSTLNIAKKRGILDCGGTLYTQRISVSKKPPVRFSNELCTSKVVCLTGFGYSGSGAALDLLSEYDNTKVIHFVDTDSSLKKSDEGFEFDFLKNLGGLFSLELAFQTENRSIRDQLVRVFLRMVAWLHTEKGGVFDVQFLSKTREFLDKIISIRSDAAHGWDGCEHLRVLGNAGANLIWGKDGDRDRECYFYLKNLSVTEFRKIAHDYLQSVLAGISASEYLVFDQICSDGSADIEKYEEYLGPIKLLAVYRDPRDVYVTGRLKNEDFIPKDVESFVAWYKNKLSRYFALNNTHFKLFRFEDLVNQYDSSINEIEKFIGLNPMSHKYRLQCFDPQISQKNIGLYKRFGDQRIIQAIEKALEMYCYESRKLSCD